MIANAVARATGCRGDLPPTRGGATWQAVADLAADTTSYRDRDEARDGAVAYVVVAVNAAGESAPSNVASADPAG